MPEFAFVMSPGQNWFFREFVETLQHELAEQGVPSSVHTDGFPEPTPERVYVLVPPHEYVALEGEDALPDEAILRRTIFICAEQPGTVHLEQDIELSRRAGAVFDISARSVAQFRRAGIPARHLRPGYSALRDRFDPEADRDIDVVFLGASPAPADEVSRRLRASAGPLQQLPAVLGQLAAKCRRRRPTFVPTPSGTC